MFITHDLDEAVLLADRILVLKAHPGEIADFIEVPVMRPRHAAQAAEPPFLATRARLDALIHPPVLHDDDAGATVLRLVAADDEVE